MKKILLVSHETKLNGAPRSLVSIAEILKSDFQLIFLLPSEDGELLEILEKHGFNYYIIKEIGYLYNRCCISLILLNIKITHAIFRLIKTQKINIIHLNTSASRFALVSALFAKIKIIWFVREYYHKPLIQLFHSVLIRFGANRIVVNSNYLKTRIAIKRTNVIYNSVMLPQSEPSSPKDSRSLLFMGRVTKDKGVDDLIEAFHLIHDHNIHLDIIGYCPDLKYYEQKLQDLNLIGCVHIHGFVEDIHNYLMKSRVVVLPSHRESFGRVLLEAFAYRRPIIATRVGGIPEIVDSTCGILIQPGDKNGLANAIRKLLDSDELTHQLGLAGYLKLTAKFSWTEYCRKVLKVHKY